VIIAHQPAPGLMVHERFACNFLQLPARSEISVIYDAIEIDLIVERRFAVPLRFWPVAA
jgi:hypothetical protein